MNAKELWNMLENNCRQDGDRRYPNSKVFIDSIELSYVEKYKDTYKVFVHRHSPFYPSLYGTPAENLTGKFASALQKDFGLIKDITDKDYVVNSYHVDPRENIDAFSKLTIEGNYLALSSGGAVSYIETSDMQKNPEAVVSVIQHMHNTIMYSELNTKLDSCNNCGYQGELKITKTKDGDFRFTCPRCGCDDPDKQLITRRICGYLGTVNGGNSNKGRLDDIYHRVVHLDSDADVKNVCKSKAVEERQNELNKNIV